MFSGPSIVSISNLTYMQSHAQYKQMTYCEHHSHIHNYTVNDMFIAAITIAEVVNFVWFYSLHAFLQLFIFNISHM